MVDCSRGEEIETFVSILNTYINKLKQVLKTTNITNTITKPISSPILLNAAQPLSQNTQTTHTIQHTTKIKKIEEVQARRGVQTPCRTGEPIPPTGGQGPHSYQKPSNLAGSSQAPRQAGPGQGALHSIIKQTEVWQAGQPAGALRPAANPQITRLGEGLTQAFGLQTHKYQGLAAPAVFYTGQTLGLCSTAQWCENRGGLGPPCRAPEGGRVDPKGLSKSTYVFNINNNTTSTHNTCRSAEVAPEKGGQPRLEADINKEATQTNKQLNKIIQYNNNKEKTYAM